ncbi:FAD-dependent oxidoreductase [Chloroflexota bacterium]
MATDMYAVNRAHLLKLLSEPNVQILTGTTVSEIAGKGATMTDRSGKRNTLDADTIVLAVGLKSDNKLLEALKDKAPETYSIGDCVEPRWVIDTMREGFRLARLI